MAPQDPDGHAFFFQGDALLCCDMRLAGGQVVVDAVIGQAPQDSQRALPTLTVSEGAQIPELGLGPGFPLLADKT